MPLQSQKANALFSLLAITFLVSVSLKLISLPINRVIEDRYCIAYYRKHDSSVIDREGRVNEQHCKLGIIQQQVGLLVGALETIAIGCDVLSTAPLAYLADVYGRQRILLLNLGAMLLRLVIVMAVTLINLTPIATILLAPILSVLGGSVSLNTSLLLAFASDMAQTEAQRSTYISWLYCLPFIAGMIGPSIAAFTMSKSLSIPLLLAVCFNLCALPLVHLLPSEAAVTPELKRRSSNDAVETSRLLEQDAGSFQSREESLGEVLTHLVSVRASLDVLNSYAKILTEKPTFRVLLLGFFLTGVASASSMLIPLFLSTRFGWTFARIGVIFSFKAIINLAMSVIIVPAYSNMMRSHVRTKSQASHSDQIGGIATLTISAIAAVFLALASSKAVAISALCFYAVGSVAGTFMYAISRSPNLALLDGSNDARGYALIVLVHSLGGFVASPIMAWLWARMVAIDGGFLGLPFCLSAVAYICCAVVLKHLR